MCLVPISSFQLSNEWWKTFNKKKKLIETTLNSMEMCANPNIEKSWSQILWNSDWLFFCSSGNSGFSAPPIIYTVTHRIHHVQEVGVCVSLLRGYFTSQCLFCLYDAVVLVNLWKSSSIRVGGSLEQPYELICLKGLVFARFQILKETITAFTFFVLHHPRYL